MSIRVLIADDHGIVRSGLRLLLEREAGIEVIGEAAAGDLEVVDLLQRDLDPGDVLVVLVRRIRGPVAVGREDLHGDQRVGLEGLGRAEVVHLAAGVAGTAQLDVDIKGPNGLTLARHYVLDVKAATQILARRSIRTLAKG